jgi:predicted SnoaL-like aldol condensation-catalyzing enzyme
MDYDMDPTNHHNDQELEMIDILEFSCEIYPDLRRVKVNFLLSSFLENPNASLTLINPEKEELVSVNIVNIFSQANEITLHIPANQNRPGEYQVKMDLFYLQEEMIGDEEDQEVSIKTIPIRSRLSTFSIK